MKQAAVMICAPIAWFAGCYAFFTARTLWRNSHCGRRVCAWCKKDMGCARALKRGQVTHGICSSCQKQWTIGLPTP